MKQYKREISSLTQIFLVKEVSWAITCHLLSDHIKHLNPNNDQVIIPSVNLGVMLVSPPR